MRLARLPSSLFSVVMATGIVGLACAQVGWRTAALALQAIAAFALVACWLLYLGRVTRTRHVVAQELADRRLAPGHWTAVAGTSVVGSGCAVLWSDLHWAAALLALAATAWLIVTLSIAVNLAKTRAPAAPVGAAWLLAVVALQSLAVLVGLVSPASPTPLQAWLDAAAVAAWLAGIALYLVLAILLVRQLLRGLDRVDFTPAWWITMGAMAISALAGAQLVLDAPGAPVLRSVLPVLRAGTLACWIVGTAWLPLLVVLQLKRGSWRYDFSLWTAVFPLGMYSMASARMGTTLGLPALHAVAGAAVWVAIAAWLATAGGLLRRAAARPLR